MMTDFLNNIGEYYFRTDSDDIDDSVTSYVTTWSSKKIKSEIADIIDDNVITTDKTWSSKKISDEISYLDCGTF